MVPDTDCAIGACGGKGVVGWVEGKRVDGPDVVEVVDGLSMALESVLLSCAAEDGSKYSTAIRPSTDAVA